MKPNGLSIRCASVLALILNLELAQANDALHAPLLKKQPQYLSFADAKGKPLPLGHDMPLRLVDPEWVGPDIIRVRGAWLDAPPKKYPAATEPLGHADGAIQFWVRGSLERVGPDTFRLWGGGGVLAFHPGDATCRYAEQFGFLSVKRLERGKPQTITFSLPAKLKTTDFPLKLEATSDSSLPVRFAVTSGPAVIREGRLELAEVPEMARWPLEIEVQASQCGSAIEPLVQTAEPVRHTVEVVGPR